MTPKEKAKELVERMKAEIPFTAEPSAVQCALIAVEEIRIAINFAWKDLVKLEREDAYWQKVEQEIAILNLPSF
jgi:hypothetical protein